MYLQIIVTLRYSSLCGLKCDEMEFIREGYTVGPICALLLQLIQSCKVHELMHDLSHHQILTVYNP